MQIPASIEPLIQQRLKSGRYESLEKLLAAALASLEEIENEDLQEIRALVQQGIDDLDENGGIPAEQVLNDLRRLQKAYRNEPGR